MEEKNREASEAIIQFPYPSFRRGQREVAEAVKKVVEKGEALLLNAPTGFGKTVAVLYGLLLAGAERVLYAVRTRNEIEPVLRELSKFNVEYVFLFSARRMCPLLRGEEAPPPDEFWENCRLARLKGVCPYFENTNQVTNIKGVVLNVLRRTAPSPYAAVKELQKLGLCPFFSLKSVVDEVRFVVVTYPYVFRRDIFESVFDPHDYSDFVIVVDEAHSLIDAQSMLEQRIRRRDVELFAAEVEKYASDSEWGRQVASKLSKLLSSIKPPPEGKLKLINKHRILSIVEDPGALSDLAAEIRLEKFREALSQGLDKATRIKVAASKIALFASLAAMDGVEVFVARGRGGEPELVALPVDPGLVTREVFTRAKALILMSGTLPPEKFVRDVLGLERRSVSMDVELLFGSFIARKYYAIVAVELTSRYEERSDRMFRLYAEYIARLHKLIDGVVLVAYPSYEFLTEVLKRMPEHPKVVETRDLSIDEAREKVFELLDSEGKVIVHAVAGGKLVEGVEFVRDGRSVVKAVFLAGVPYPQPDDYTKCVLEHLSERLGSGEANYYVYTVTAYVKSRQVLGRGVRSEQDRVLYVLGDRRYLSRRLRELMRIRYHAVVSNIESFEARVKEAIRKLGLSSG